MVGCFLGMDRGRDSGYFAGMAKVAGSLDKAIGIEK